MQYLRRLRCGMLPFPRYTWGLDTQISSIISSFQYNGAGIRLWPRAGLTIRSCEGNA